MIRLTKTGRKHESTFRVVVTQKQRAADSSRYLEILGNYNPALKERNLKAERINYWLEKGAQPSATVHNLLVSAGILKAKKVKAHQTKFKETEEITAPAEVEQTKTEAVEPASEASESKEEKVEEKKEEVAEPQ